MTRLLPALSPAMRDPSGGGALTLTDLTVLTAFFPSSALSTLVIVVRGSPVRDVIVFVQIPASERSRRERVSDSLPGPSLEAGRQAGLTVVAGVLNLIKHHLLLAVHLVHPAPGKRCQCTALK